MKEQILTWLNRFLVANIFFVLFSFFWFVIALVGRSLNVPLGFDIWFSLWEPVFTPAIGILMAGAIMVGLINQITKRLNRS